MALTGGGHLFGPCFRTELQKVSGFVFFFLRTLERRWREEIVCCTFLALGTAAKVILLLSSELRSLSSPALSLQDRKGLFFHTFMHSSLQSRALCLVSSSSHIVSSPLTQRSGLQSWNQGLFGRTHSPRLGSMQFDAFQPPLDP